MLIVPDCVPLNDPVFEAVTELVPVDEKEGVLEAVCDAVDVLVSEILFDDVPVIVCDVVPVCDGL